jgi:hypothetical protein
MFNLQGEILLDIGSKGCDQIDVDLAEGERIVGVCSRLHSQGNPVHCNLTFIIGRLE